MMKAVASGSTAAILVRRASSGTRIPAARSDDQAIVPGDAPSPSTITRCKDGSFGSLTASPEEPRAGSSVRTMPR